MEIIQAHPVPQSLAAEGQPTQSDESTGALSHIRGMAVKTWEVVTRNPKEKLALVLASVACEKAAELVLNPTPATADSSLQAKCANVALNRSHATSTLLHAGKAGQGVNASINFDPMPADCEDVYKGVSQWQARLRDPQNPDRLFKLTSYNQGGVFDDDAGGNGFNESLRTPPTIPGAQVKCAPGAKKWWNKAYIQVKNSLVNVTTGKTVATKVKQQATPIMPKSKRHC